MAVTTLKSTARPDSSKPGWGLTPQDVEARYEGAVFGTWEHNGYDDSDFFALVWVDGKKGSPGHLDEVCWSTTRCWTYANGAKVDATAQAKAKAARWLRARYIEAWDAATKSDARQVERGRRVRVVRGRTVPIGTEGEVFWIGPGHHFHSPDRIGLKDADGTAHWTSISNVEVADPEQYETPHVEIVRQTRARIRRLVREGTSGEWASMYLAVKGRRLL